MISTINVQMDSPNEYYAAHRRRCLTEPSPSSFTDDDENNNNNNNVEKTASKIPRIKIQSCSIFYRPKRAHQTQYLLDGRKIYDGKAIFPASARKLWTQLIVRTMIEKMEDEIKDPAEAMSKLNDSLPILSKEHSVSTFSLVSKNRVESACDKCTSKNVITHWRQIAKSSTDLYENSFPSYTESPTKGQQQFLSPTTNYCRSRSNSIFSYK